PIFAAEGAGMEKLDENSLSRIRPIGIRCEKAMFTATGGVNTHKGAIFSLGIVAAAAGHCAAYKHDLTAETVCTAASIIAKSAERDFDCLPQGEPMTKGRELYIKYGMRGIRGEAADGFPSVRAALPELRRLMDSGAYTDNDIHLQTLLHLMTTVADTNVAARCGPEAVEIVHAEAKRILAAGGALTTQGLSMMYMLDHAFTRQNISPGGCADLLSVTVVLYHLEQLGKKLEETCYDGL
ncbi:MAG: triphosphoribosyl-dephospho-CoA synthase, partial [Angelakisella sp.]